MHLLSRAGRILGEMTISRLAGDRFYALSAAAAELRDLDVLSQGVRPGETVNIENVTQSRGVIVVSGPRSRDVLSRLTDTPLDNEHFRWLSAQEITVAGQPLRALRVSYVGELGWELHPPTASLPALTRKKRRTLAGRSSAASIRFTRRPVSQPVRAKVARMASPRRAAWPA